jgi:hypothetical protein
MAANQTANFVVKAKDAATGPLGKVGGSMGKLRRTAGTAFKAIAGAALAAAGAIAAFTASAVKGAIEDERSVILTNAALKARGFALDALAPKIEEQIKAAQRLGIADDRVRAGLEVGSRFFKDQTKLLKANELAMTISAATGEDLESVVAKIGKASNGSTRGLAAMIGPIEKGAKFSDLYAQGMSKFQGVADELANSTSGKFAAAQEIFNEQMDDFGAKFLPVVSEALTFLTEKALPAFQSFLEDVGPVISDIVDNYVRPLVDSFAELFAVFTEGEGSISLLDVAFFPLKATLTIIKALIDGIVFGLKLIGIGKGSGAAQALSAAAANAGYGGSSFVNATNAGGGGNAAALSSTYIIPITIGTGKVDTVVADSIKRIGPGPRRGR